MSDEVHPVRRIETSRCGRIGGPVRLQRLSDSLAARLERARLKRWPTFPVRSCAWSRVRPEASFIDDLGADSLALAELTLVLEETFDIEIADEEPEAISDRSRRDDRGHEVCEERGALDEPARETRA